MDIKYITPFVDATRHIIKDFFDVEPEPLNPYLMKRDDPHRWEISAVIGIAGETRGVVVLSFYEDLAYTLTKKLTGVEVDGTESDMVDTIGEVVNIVAGNAKKGLEQFKLVISLPSIIRGEGHHIAWPGTGVPIIGIPFKTPYGEFHLSVGLENIIK